MVAVMAAVTLWSAAQGGQGPVVMAASAVGAVAAMMVLETGAAALPPTRLLSAAFAGAWILVFMPAWDWLAGQFLYPESLWTALLFAVGFAGFRYLITP